jgi:hypothetical protein
MVEPIDISAAVAEAKRLREKKTAAKEAANQQKKILNETIDMERVETPVEEDMVAAFDKAEAEAIKATCDKLKAATADAEFILNEKGNILKNDPSNIKLAIHKLGILIRQDLFKNESIIHGLHGELHILTDIALRELRHAVNKQFGFLPDEKPAWDIAKHLGWTNRFHPVRDYFGCLIWDGTLRLDNLFKDYFNAEPIDYLASLGSTWFILAVRRIKNDGKEFQQRVLPLLQSGQGECKGDALSILAVRPEWFSDEWDPTLSPKEMLEIFTGKLIVEHPEMDSIRKVDTGRVKIAATRVKEKARKAYDHEATERVRQYVLVATANPHTVFHDPTGNRRWYPVQVKNIDVEKLRRDRDQLWAEAVHRESAGESTEIPREFWATQAAEASKRLERSEITQTIVDELNGENITELLNISDAERKNRGEQPMTRGGLFIERTDVWGIVGLLNIADQTRYGRDRAKAMEELGWVPWRLRIKENKNPTAGFAKKAADDKTMTRPKIQIIADYERDPAVPFNLRKPLRLSLEPIAEAEIGNHGLFERQR